MFDINRGNKNKFPQCFRWLSKKTHSPFLTANVVWVNYWALCFLCPGEWICKHSLLIYRWFWAEWLHIWWYDERNDSRPTLKDQMYVMAFSEDVSQIQQVVIYLCLCTYIGMWVRRGEHNWKRRSCYDISIFSNRLWQTVCDAEIYQISLPSLTLCVSCLKFLFDSSLGKRDSH